MVDRNTEQPRDASTAAAGKTYENNTAIDAALATSTIQIISALIFCPLADREINRPPGRLCTFQRGIF